MANFFSEVLDILLEKNVLIKCQKVSELNIDKNTDFSRIEVKRILVAGIPNKPELVRFQQVPKRKNQTEGLIHTIHAIAHIEFNAINLALDALYRFQELPKKYYIDWLKVAKEEALHFIMVENYLNELGYKYGDFSAHNGLWEMAVKTDNDVMVRMALVPRVLEARGLDVTPSIQKKFKNSDFQKMVGILDRIFKDEIGHVAIGSYWFEYLTKQRNLNPVDTFKKLIKEYFNENLRKPFNFEARKNAGFSQQELEYLLSF
ncbi:COG2833: uncharacterized protein [hydrothermal vent metagenome]|uniref:COG2833: uncharacterized protein n=1 Tax=hydrothermal vent metagenome TaxID=652676 RepID=A0A1W1BP58_9ZZZZ